MRKLFFAAAIAVIGITSMNGQSFMVGAQGALPIGDFDDFYSFGVAVEGAYLFEINDAFQVGPTAGVTHYFGKDFEAGAGGFEVEIEGADDTFMPIGGTARFFLGESFYFGTDLGYAVGISDGNEGGFFYKPRASYMVSESLGIVLAYSNILGDGATLSSVNAGVEICF